MQNNDAPPESQPESIARMESLLAEVNSDAERIAERMRGICRMAEAIKPFAVQTPSHLEKVKARRVWR